MARVKIDFGTEVDFLNQGELDKSLHGALNDHAAHREEARLSGLKAIRNIGRPFAAVSTTAAYTILSSPSQGYVWSLRSVIAQLSAAETISFWLGSDTSLGTLPSPNGLTPLGTVASTTIGGVTFGRGQVMVYPGEYVIVAAGGSATLNSYLYQAWEVPAELQGKLN